MAVYLSAILIALGLLPRFSINNIAPFLLPLFLAYADDILAMAEALEDLV